METIPRQIVAFGGGGFSMEPGNPLLDDYVLGLTGAERPLLSQEARGYRLDLSGQRVVEMRIATAFLGDRDVAPAAPLLEALSTPSVPA